MEGTVEGTVFNCLFISIGNPPKGANCSHWILLDSSKNVLVYSRYLLWILCTLTLRLENSKPHTNGRVVVGVTYSKLWLIVKHCGIVYHCPLSAPPCLGWAFKRRWRGKNRIKMLTRSWQLAKLSHSHLPLRKEFIAGKKMHLWHKPGKLHQIVFICGIDIY